MGAAVGFAAQGLSLVFQGAAEAQGQRYKAEQSDRAATIGKIQADQVDSAYRDELSTTFSNIRAIRAATGGDPNSPSALAYMGAQAEASDRTRRIKAGGLRMQATQDANDALFYRSSAKSALLGTAAKSLAYFATPPAGTFA